MVRGSTLDTSATNWDVNFYSCSELGTSKLLILRLASLYNWDSKKLLVSLGIDIKDIEYLLLCFLISLMSSMTLLPEEFSCSNKWSWVLEFPSDNVSPLVNHERQVTVTVNPFCKCWIHDSFTSWSNSDWLSHLTLSRLCNPSYFRGETF